MNKIKFSHNYYKLKGMGDKATLIAVVPYKIDDNTPKGLLEYDTSYEGGSYPLGKGKHVLLLFLGKSGVFTTIRPLHNRQGYNKLEYYSSKVGEEFEIEMNEEISND